MTISSSAYGKEHYGNAGNVSRVTRKYTGSSSGSTVSEGGPGPGRTATLQRTSASRSSDKSNDGSKGSLYRKSLSLEQNVAMPDETVKLYHIKTCNLLLRMYLYQCEFIA